MDDEILDLVDRSDTVIGQINRKDYSTLLTDDLGYIRAADMFIVNSKNKIYVPTRTADKTIAPNGYDFSVGGHVESGEDYLTTMIREAHEELHLDLRASDLILIEKTIFDDIKYINCLYMYKSDITPTFNPHDFVQAEWMDIDELIRRIDEGHLAKGKLKTSVETLQKYLHTT